MTDAKAVLYEFLDHPICPEPQNTSDPGDGMSVVIETQSIDLAKRDDLGSFPYSSRVHAWTAVMLGVSAFSEVMRLTWDVSIGSDTLNSWEIRDIISAHPDDDPASVIGERLCDFKHARQDLKVLKETTQEFCVPSWNRSDTSPQSLAKRVFRADHRTTQPTSAGSTEINTGALLQRILDTDDVPFLYSRITRYSHLERLPPVGTQTIGTPRRGANGRQIMTEQANLEGTYLVGTAAILPKH